MEKFKTHRLKTWPLFWIAIADGVKSFELRKNDRDFQVGDILELEMYDPETETHGMIMAKHVTYILHGGQFGLQEGYVIMGFDQTSYNSTPTNRGLK